MKSDEKKCPQCAEIIKRDARVCRYCQYTFSDEELAASAPQASGLKMMLWLGGGAVALLMIGSLTSNNKKTPDRTANALPAEATATGAPGAPAKPAELESKWHYDTSKDEMRGTTTRHATVESSNSVEMAFPYNGGVTGTIDVRKQPTDGLQVMFRLTKGQILCSTYSSHYLHVKFDNGAVGRYSCGNASDGSSEVAFFNAPSTILAKLKRAKTTVIEAELYDNGSRQWSFPTAGLKW